MLTNTAYHTVCVDFIEIDLENVPVRTPNQPVTGLLIFPNPAGQEVRVQMETTEFLGGQIRLLDVYGRVLWQQTAFSETLILRRNGLAGGVYFVEFEGENGLRVVRRVVFE